MTEDEKLLGLKVIHVCYWGLIIALLVSIGVQVFAGFKSWVWYIAVPIWALINLGLRVLKRYFRNIIDDVEADIALDSEIPDTEVSSIGGISKTLNLKSIILVLITMLVVSSLWYSVGVIVGKIL